MKLNTNMIVILRSEQEIQQFKEMCISELGYKGQNYFKNLQEHFEQEGHVAARLEKDEWMTGYGRIRTYTGHREWSKRPLVEFSQIDKPIKIELDSLAQLLGV